MATRAANKLAEHKVNVNGIEITVQLTEDEAAEMQATKGKAEADKTPTVPLQSVIKGDFHNGRDDADNPFDPDAAKAPGK
jgi:hypothetical protein